MDLPIDNFLKINRQVRSWRSSLFSMLSSHPYTGIIRVRYRRSATILGHPLSLAYPSSRMNVGMSLLQA